MRLLVLAFNIAFVAGTAMAAEFPPRKAGLWELKMGFDNRPVAAGSTMQQCTDAATDAMMHSQPGVVQQCSKRDVQISGNTMTMDSICTANGKTSETHTVVTGSFDSAYTMKVTTKNAGEATLGPGEMAQLTVTMDAKWLGPCKADQIPGDIIMPGGVKMNVRTLPSSRPPAGAPPPR